MIIDANVIPCIFSPRNSKHEKFRPVLKWLLYGRGKIILGGKLYTKEILEKQKSYVSLMLELKKINKIHFIDNSLVDLKEKEVSNKELDPDFDDPHIIALSILSKATIICSDDSRSFKFIKRMKEYDNDCIVPKIYTSVDHSPHTEILCDGNICSNGEHNILNKSVSDKFWKTIEGINNS
jgi:hypothetical protein